VIATPLTQPAGLAVELGLTQAEAAVLRLLVAGASNADISRARGTSVRTIANQVASLLRKLGAASRYDLIRRWTLIETDERHGSPDLFQLTADEREVVWLAANGHSYKYIAYELGCPIGTTAGRLRRAMRKLGFATRTELLRKLGQASPAA
jgi:DNA-binding CsgD family transcriptional regulator